MGTILNVGWEWAGRLPSPPLQTERPHKAEGRHPAFPRSSSRVPSPNPVHQTVAGRITGGTQESRRGGVVRGQVPPTERAAAAGSLPA